MEGLAHRKIWAGNNPQKVRELSRKYGEDKEENMAYNQEYHEGSRVRKLWLQT